MEDGLIGHISERESGIPVSGLKIRCLDDHLTRNAPLGAATTDRHGDFTIDCGTPAFRAMRMPRPGIDLTDYASPRSPLSRSGRSVRFGANPARQRDPEIAERRLGALPPVPPERRPGLHKEVVEREDRLTEARPPEGESAGLDRIDPDADDAIAPCVRKDEGSGAAVVEAPHDLKPREIPEIETEPIDARSGEGVDLKTDFDGLLPEPLPVRIAPALVRGPRQVGKVLSIPGSVFMPDTRYIFGDAAFPWCTTGRVETESGYCTGALIGRRLLLAACHCVAWENAGAGWVKFTPSYYGSGCHCGVAGATRVIYWTRRNRSGGRGNTEIALDGVVLVLDRNMGALPGYPGCRPSNSPWHGGVDRWRGDRPSDLSGGRWEAVFLRPRRGDDG